MNKNNIPNSEEIKKFYTLFCEVFTSFYNYAIAKGLYEDKVYSWSIVSYYYSLMHCGRAICFISLNCFPKGHKDLHDFLSGKDIKNKKFWTLEEPNGTKRSYKHSKLINNISEISKELDISRMKNLGDNLKKLKNIREFNSYEMFIVSHQIKHSVLSSNLEVGTEKISELVKQNLIFLTELLFYYIRDKNDCYKAFLLDNNPTHNWAFEYLVESLNEQKIDYEIIEEAKKIIRDNLLSKIFVRDECPDEFYKPIKFKFFDVKSKIILDFINTLCEIK